MSSNNQPSPERRRLTVGDAILAALFGATILVVAAQVLWRYVFNNSLVWTEEVSRLLFVWMTFAGAALAVGADSHIRVDLLVSRLPRRAQWGLRLAQLVVMLVFLGVMVGVGVQWVHINSNTRTPALGLPLNYVLYAALPTGFLAALAMGLWRLVRLMRGEERQAAPPRDEEAI